MHGSTTYLHEGFGSFASRATVMGGGAVLAAAENFLAGMKAVAAARLGVAPDALRTSEGTVIAADGRVIGLADLAAAGISADGSFANSKSTYAYGTAAAHVRLRGNLREHGFQSLSDRGRADENENCSVQFGNHAGIFPRTCSAAFDKAPNRNAMVAVPMNLPSSAILSVQPNSPRHRSRAA